MLWTRAAKDKAGRLAEASSCSGRTQPGIEHNTMGGNLVDVVVEMSASSVVGLRFESQLLPVTEKLML